MLSYHAFDQIKRAARSYVLPIKLKMIALWYKFMVGAKLVVRITQPAGTIFLMLGVTSRVGIYSTTVSYARDRLQLQLINVTETPTYLTNTHQQLRTRLQIHFVAVIYRSWCSLHLLAFAACNKDMLNYLI